MKVLIACEFSGTVRSAFAEKGHDAYSCDLLPGEITLFKNNAGHHIVGDVLRIVDQGWDLMIAHPPCTFLSYAGAKYWNFPGRSEKRYQAYQFVMALWNSKIEKICIENPVGWLNTKFRKPDQVIHPYHFGEPYRKRTCLWLKNLPLLISTDKVAEIPFYDSKGKRKVSTDIMGKGSGDLQRKNRSIFWQGIAAAVAEQWG